MFRGYVHLLPREAVMLGMTDGWGLSRENTFQTPSSPLTALPFLWGVVQMILSTDGKIYVLLIHPCAWTPQALVSIL